MNLTVSPLNNQRKQNFTAINPSTVPDAIEREITQKSSLFKPLENCYDKATDAIAKNFTSKIADWEPLHKLAEKFKNNGNLYLYCSTIGAFITSGLYMQRTYTNNKLEKDRRNTLVVNQGLTLGLSTAGSFLLDKYLKSWWENITARFAGHLLNDKDFHKKFVSDKKNITKENKTLAKDAKKKLPNLMGRIEEHNYFKGLDNDAKKVLSSKIKGMGLLRTMFVFGFVYRFFVPVAVTKPSNKLCEMYLERKRAKEAGNTQKTN